MRSKTRTGIQRPENPYPSVSAAWNVVTVIRLALNEVCNGFEMPEFETCMTAEREEVLATMPRIKTALSAVKRGSLVCQTLGDNDMRIIREALVQVSLRMSELGMTTRMRVSQKEDVDRILNDVTAIVGI